MLFARFFVILVVCLGLLAGCQHSSPEPQPEKPDPVFLEARQQVTVAFPANGQWYKSGFVARPGDVLVFHPQGPARHLSETALEVMVGMNLAQVVRAGKPQLVEQAGPVIFRFRKDRGEYFPGKDVEIQIQNIREAGMEDGE